MKHLSFIIAFCIALFVNAQQFEPKWVGEVSIAQIQRNDTVMIPTEKANVKIKTSNSAGRLLVGIGNTRRKVVIQGGESPVRINPDGEVTLIIKCKDNESDPSSFIQIVKFENKKKERRTELSNINWVGNVSQGNMELVPYDADQYGKASYILKFQPAEGEYGVRVLNPNEKDEKVTIFYCFGIHNEK